MENRKLKLLTQEDTQCFEQIAKQHAAIGAMFGSEYSPTTEVIKKFFNELVEIHHTKQSFCMIAEDCGNLISYIWAHKKNKVLNIYSLWTKENFRGQGIATQLKKEMEKWAKDHKITRIDTTISIENKKMLEINEKL